MYTKKEIKELETAWKTSKRWQGIKRPYSAEDVVKMRGSLQFDYPVARHGAETLFNLLQKEKYIKALGALTGNQAVQQVLAGLKAIYASGWQVAADANDSLETYPDQSLYPTMSMPHLVRRIQNALRRADQIQHLENKHSLDWFVPIVADAEAGFGGPLNCFELIKALIEAGAAAIHLEDQLSSLKKCGHMGGKVLVPAHEFVEKLITARFAADVLGVPTLLIARTDSLDAGLIRLDCDEVDKPFISKKRSKDGFFYLNGGLDFAIARSLHFAPYADLIWCETKTPDLKQAKEFAEAIHKVYPKKWLAYNCSPSFNWKKHLNDSEIATFQEKLASFGYKFQFVTLAGFHTLNASMFKLANGYEKTSMSAYSSFQQEEFSLAKEHGFTAIKHQAFVGAGYYDALSEIIKGREADETSALKGSTEEEQFGD